MWPTQPPVQSVSRPLSWGYGGHDVELTTHIQLCAALLHSPIRHYGVALKYAREQFYVFRLQAEDKIFWTQW